MSATGQEPTQQGDQESQQLREALQHRGRSSQQDQQDQGDQESQGGAGQEPEVFDAAYVQNLRREAARHRTEAAQLKQQVRDHEQAQMTEQQKLESRAATAEAARQTAELQLARYEIAVAKEIPTEWIEFLSGSSREELEANADKLKQRISAMGQASSRDFGAGARPNGKASPEEDFNSVLRRSAGRPR